MSTEKAYREIFEVLDKHKDIIVFDTEDLRSKSKLHLYGIELKEKHGLNVAPNSVYSLDRQRFGDYRTIGLYGEKYNRTISWSDDGSQPDDELLLLISFPTGPFIFGEDYPEELFKKFFLELKSYGPKHVDTANKSLYFSIDKASKVFNEFNSILKKYDELNRVDYKRRQIAKLEEELKGLKKV